MAAPHVPELHEPPQQSESCAQLSPSFAHPPPELLPELLPPLLLPPVPGSVPVGSVPVVSVLPPPLDEPLDEPPPDEPPDEPPPDALPFEQATCPVDGSADTSPLAQEGAEVLALARFWSVGLSFLAGVASQIFDWHVSPLPQSES